MKKIEVKNLTKIFNKIPVIDKISFYLEDNNTLGILGPNGSGKSTTIGILLGLIKQTSGEILINNTYVNDKNRFNFLSILNFRFSLHRVTQKADGNGKLKYLCKVI